MPMTETLHQRIHSEWMPAFLIFCIRRCWEMNGQELLGTVLLTLMWIGMLYYRACRVIGQKPRPPILQRFRVFQSASQLFMTNWLRPKNYGRTVYTKTCGFGRRFLYTLFFRIPSRQPLTRLYALGAANNGKTLRQTVVTTSRIPGKRRLRCRRFSPSHTIVPAPPLRIYPIGTSPPSRQPYWSEWRRNDFLPDPREAGIGLIR